ncbi:isochorismate synthase [Tumidithrix helvetica PCC 7403]|uniref:isochorismate synthase n=1 Tax=Tumidithrix helvetica TaxID=3457545 RepID=UPI003CA34AF3
MQLRQGNTPSSYHPNSLHDLIRSAIAKAKNLDRPVLLSYSQTWLPGDPLLFLATHAQPTQPQFYWEQPSKDWSVAAAGSVVSLSISNPILCESRFEQAKRFSTSLLADAVVGNAADLEGLGLDANLVASPYVLGGFAFHEAIAGFQQDNWHSDRATRNGEKIWHGFPPVMWFVPRWILHRTGGRSIVTVHAYIQPQDLWEAIASSLATTLMELRHSSQENSQDRAQGNSQNAFIEHTPFPFSAPTSLRTEEVLGIQSWSGIVEQALDLIQQQKLDKVVLARALDVSADRAFNPFAVLHKLRCDYPECVSFLVNCGSDDTFLGATPELLLQVKSHANYLGLRSNAVAGSIQRGKTEAEDRILSDRLLNSQKDINEHKIVIHSICDRLQSMGAQLDKLAPTQLLRLSNVQHLYTPITAKLPNADWSDTFDVLAKLHPTAAVGGEPRDRAVQLMQQWEACDRGWYAAPIGWLNGNGEGAFAVGIRSGYICGDRARIFAGAGIVANSQVTTEQSETTIKFAALLKALGVT